MSAGDVDLGDLTKLEDWLRQMCDSDAELDAFCSDCVLELGKRLMAKAIKRTPVGQYPISSGKVGGTLRRGWTIGKQGTASVGVMAGVPSRTVTRVTNQGEVQPVEIAGTDPIAKGVVEKTGGAYTTEVINPVEYASYVEYGHRTSNHEGWVPGKFMMTKSADEIQRQAPAILARKVQQFFHDHTEWWD